jgi:thiamine-phosphate pyrophosphorylase
MSSPIAIDNEIEEVSRLLANDEIDFFHLNKPGFEFSQMNQFLLQIDSSLHHKIMIHSHYSLIEKYYLAGISINSTDLSQLAYEEEVDKCSIQPMVLINRGIEINKVKPSRLSYSAHSFNEIKELAFDTDYVFLSPIYDSISKIGYQSKFIDLGDLKKSLKSTKTKVVALGGVKTEHKLLLNEAGFFGFVIQCI